MASQVGFNNFDSSYWYMPNASNTATKPKTQAQNNGALLQDTVEISGKKKSNTKKVVAGLGIAATIGAIIYCAATGKFSRAKQLAEHIDFKPAQTLEDAINYGKIHFDIRSYYGFTEKDLEVLNYINEGFTNIYNKCNGKIKIPRLIDYGNFSKYLGEEVPMAVKSTEYMMVNKDFFSNIDNHLTNAVTGVDELLCFFNKEDKEFITKIIENYNSGKYKTLKQKCNVCQVITHINDRFNYYCTDPNNSLKFFDDVIKESNYKLEYKGKPFSYKEAVKWSSEEKDKFVASFFKLIKDDPEIKIPLNRNDMVSEFGWLYHELGHVNDPHLMDRAKLFTNNPEAVRISAKVSEYAKISEDEFVAEVFKKLVSGKKLPDDVMKLYQELGGPMVS